MVLVVLVWSLGEIETKVCGLGYLSWDTVIMQVSM